ncbi:hypothetical protein [Gordonia iterans]|uniref:hypothetical protein n=1 Tax=Gordonia iterans TaxID=1004901 RepID=UPI00131C9230|nr:hypothetical protein [Gordonia iterans]
MKTTASVIAATLPEYPFADCIAVDRGDGTDPFLAPTAFADYYAARDYTITAVL